MANKLERFTQRARRVLTLAQEEAERLSHNYIGTEHLLLGLIREENGVYDGKIGSFLSALFNPEQPPAQLVDPKDLESYGVKHARIFFIAGRVAAGDAHLKIARQWLDEHYSFIDQVVTQTVTIRLYATNTK